ncbi:hypothetical protein [Streptomyces sp. NPDC007205]|uniref:hypothetical protein n=1 Tax=Streptomyces sp. NPDC007205 TaxID=3154316 RepID=UPI0033F327D6
MHRKARGEFPSVSSGHSLRNFLSIGVGRFESEIRFTHAGLAVKVGILPEGNAANKLGQKVTE